MRLSPPKRCFGGGDKVRAHAFGAGVGLERSSTSTMSPGTSASHAAIVPGAPVWIKATGDTGEAFTNATVKSVDSSGGKCTVEENGAERTVGIDECSPANPDDMVTPDNTFLIHISEPTILCNVRDLCPALLPRPPRAALTLLRAVRRCARGSPRTKCTR